MILLIALILIATAFSFASVRLALLDGRGPAQPPRSRFQDPRFIAPSAR